LLFAVISPDWLRKTKKAQLYAGFDMNATFDRLFNQSNEEYEKLTDQD
jgi:hypothetical protein